MKVKIEFQYFEGCPNHQRMYQILEEAIVGLHDKLEVNRILVNSLETAQQVQFRGSPTMLINGKDLEDMPPPASPALACRYYPHGLPTVSMLREKILQQLAQ